MQDVVGCSRQAIPRAALQSAADDRLAYSANDPRYVQSGEVRREKSGASVGLGRLSDLEVLARTRP